MGRAKYDCIKQKQSKNILETPYEKDLTKKGKDFLYFLENYERVLLSNIIYVSPTFLFCVYYCHMVKKLTESKPTSLFFTSQLNCSLFRTGKMKDESIKMKV